MYLVHEIMRIEYGLDGLGRAKQERLLCPAFFEGKGFRSCEKDREVAIEFEYGVSDDTIGSI